MSNWSKISIAVLALGLVACDDADTDPFQLDDDVASLSAVLNLDLANPPNYADPVYPPHYGQRTLNNDNAPNDNPVTNEGATLGRVLFYDQNLSINRTISCASCHSQSLGFGDTRRLSVGFAGGETGAHSMRLANASFYEGEVMFWNGRAHDLEDQSLQPVMDGVEMGFDDDAGGVPALVDRMEGSAYYPALFEWAFGSRAISETRMREALAQYVRSIVSTGSRLDDGLAGFGPMEGQGGGPPPRSLPGFNAQENLGLRLFSDPPDRGGAGCNACHELPTLALDEDSRSNGLDLGETVVFKSPSLKNVAVSGPYMHDGRFATLEQVIEHYNSGIQRGPALDRRLSGRGGQPDRLNLSEADKAALVAFLRTMTDQALLVDPKFSNPFIN